MKETSNIANSLASASASASTVGSMAMSSSVDTSSPIVLGAPSPVKIATPLVRESRVLSNDVNSEPNAGLTVLINVSLWSTPMRWTPSFLGLTREQ